MEDYICHWVHDDRDDKDYQLGFFNKCNFTNATLVADIFLHGHFVRSWLTYKDKVIYEGDNFGS